MKIIASIIALQLLLMGAGVKRSGSAPSPPITFRSASFNSASSTSVTVTEPSGCTTNDVEVALFYHNFSGTHDDPAGWTTLFDRNIESGFMDMMVSYIVRGGSAPSYVWTNGDGQLSIVSVLCFSGVDTSSPIDASAETVGDQTTTSPDPPSATAVSSTAMAVALGAHRAGPTTNWGTPTGYTTAGTNTSLLASAYKLLSASGAENPSVFSGAAVGFEARYGATVLLKQAP